MKDFFDNVNERLKESAERWEKIDTLAEEIKKGTPDPAKKEIDIAHFHQLIALSKLVVLLVEELRPISNVSEQAKNLQNEILDMINNFEVKK